MGLAGWILAAESGGGRGDREFTVLVYNVENLFDIDRVAHFADYAENPTDSEGYGPSKLLRKLEGIGRVLQAVNSGAGPEVVLLNEIEVDFTPESRVEDDARFLEQHRHQTVRQILTGGLTEEFRGWPAEAWLLKHLEDIGLKGYSMAVAGRGRDTAGNHDMTQKNVILSRFPILGSQTHPTRGARGILEARLDVGGRVLHVLDNHWKSGAGNPEDEKVRIWNAGVLRRRLDQILKADPQAEVLIGGDLNSHYNQRQRYPFLPRTAIQDVLGSQGDKVALGHPDGPSLYNLWFELPPGNRFSDAYEGEWGTLMHLLVARGLLDGIGIEYVDGSFRPWIVPGVNSQPPLGLPWKWTRYGPGAGTSDHFPVLARFRLLPRREARILTQNPALRAIPSEPLKVGFGDLDRSRLRNARVLATAGPEAIARAVGEIFLVDGVLSRGRSCEVDVGGRKFVVHSFNKELKESIRLKARGTSVRFIGELGVYKGRLQFVVRDPSWLE